MLLKEKYQGRAHFEADRQKGKLFKIGITLLGTKEAKFDDDEFSTLLVFNYTDKPVKAPLETTLLGFVELDEFLALDTIGLYKTFARRFKRYSNRLNNL